MIALPHGMITFVDDAMFGLVAILEDQGMSEDTVVTFTSSHGDFMGDLGLMLQHRLHKEGVLHVQHFWAGPDRLEPPLSDVPRARSTMVPAF